MPSAALVLPHQLFAGHPAVMSDQPVYLLEEQLVFGDWKYQSAIHQQKLVLHRASMRAYAHRLKRDGREVCYVEHSPDPAMANLFDRLAADGVDEVVLADPVDWLMERRLKRVGEARGVGVKFVPTPNFECPPEVYEEFFAGAGRYRQTEFYIAERKRLGVMLENGKPLGGRWTFDIDNRKRLPKGYAPPASPRIAGTAHVAEAKAHVAVRYGGNPGRAEDFNWPTTSDEAQAWLAGVCTERLSRFGDYQDAVSREHGVIHHSLLSSSLNIGLLAPGRVVEAVDAAGRERRLPYNEREGFIRQVMGWREFVRAVYALDSVRLRNGNFFGHHRPMPKAFYDATTGLEPVDAVIHRVLATGYAHHIERLMILGNIMLLCNIAPTAVYMWFMELFIDAYDWVMVPNVYGMSQFADGGGMMTKPYVSSSNYVRKMSDFPPGPWCEVWDGLYWRFVADNVEYFRSSPRLSVMTGHLKRMGEAKLVAHRRNAETFLETLW